MQDKISIKGARVHNLKNISVEIPKNIPDFQSVMFFVIGSYVWMK